MAGAKPCKIAPPPATTFFRRNPRPLKPARRTHENAPRPWNGWCGRTSTTLTDVGICCKKCISHCGEASPCSTTAARCVRGCIASRTTPPLPTGPLAGGLRAFELPKWSIENPHVVWTDGNSALLLYARTGGGSYDHRPFAPMMLASTLWTKRSGKWVAVHHQESENVP